MKTGVVNSALFHSDGYRIDPDMHLGEGVQIRRELHATPYELSTVGENASRVFYGNIFSRVFVKKPDHGVPYLAASDTVLSNLDTGYYLSKKQAAQLSNLMLKKDWILVTCSGTLGNVTYTNKVFEKYIATHDLIRVVPNDAKVNKGTLHAFLSSRYGYYQITQSQFGGVVKHVNDDQMKQVMVPVFPSTFQQEVDDLIQQSAKLREQAANALAEAVSIFEDEIGISSTDYTAYRNELISIKNIAGQFRRMDSQYQIGRKSIGIEKQNLNTIKISSIAKAIFTGNRGKRYYVDNDGIFFLSSSDMMLANPKRFCKKISRKTPNLNDLLVPKGTILISRSGSVGNTIIVGDDLKGSAVSEHAMRLIVDENKITPEYVFAYFCTKQGKDSLAILPYGSVIVTLGEEFLGDVDLPLLSDEKQKTITALVQTYTQKNDLAVANENKAITMVEEEIEKWQSPTA